MAALQQVQKGLIGLDNDNPLRTYVFSDKMTVSVNLSVYQRFARILMIAIYIEEMNYGL